MRCNPKRSPLLTVGITRFRQPVQKRLQSLLFFPLVEVLVLTGPLKDMKVTIPKTYQFPLTYRWLKVDISLQTSSETNNNSIAILKDQLKKGNFKVLKYWLCEERPGEMIDANYDALENCDLFLPCNQLIRHDDK